MARLPADTASTAQRPSNSAKNATTSVLLNSTRFDPYSSAFSKKASSTRQKRAEQAVLELRAKRQQILLSFDLPEHRNITVLTPTAAAVTQADAATAAAEDVTDDATPIAAAVANANAAVDDGADEIERATVLRLVREQVAARASKTSAFASKAARELALLQSSSVRAYALISVRFPDGVQLQARYNTERDTVQSVVDVLKHSFVSKQHSEFELYLTAPMRTLSSTAVLHDAGIRGHANLVHLRWLSESDSSSDNDSNGDSTEQQQCVSDDKSNVAVAADTMLLLRSDLTTMSVREARQQRYDVPAAVPLVLDKRKPATTTAAAATKAKVAAATAAKAAAAAAELTANGNS
jgi:UBX domain